MSATGRGAIRAEHDEYLTPPWVVHRLLERLPLQDGQWLEPAAGEGDIIKAVARPDIQWTAVDIRPACKPPLESLGASVFIDDFLTLNLTNPAHFAVGITNPPFSLAREFLEKLLPICDVVVMLSRLNWLAGEKRAAMMRNNPPDVFVLPNRPSFSGDGSTDATDYCWLVWPSERARDRGHWEVLASTPRSVRCGVKTRTAKLVTPSLIAGAIASLVDGAEDVGGDGEVALAKAEAQKLLAATAAAFEGPPIAPASDITP